MSKELSTAQSSFRSVNGRGFSHSSRQKVLLNHSHRHRGVPVVILSGNRMSKQIELVLWVATFPFI